jgi:uncharacterized LabA/DUF88 family protein
MKKFAFIDVQNTETTTLKVLKFALDHEKLFSYLKDKWKCEKIFFYPGIQHGDDARGELFTKLTELGAVVRPKYFFVYKNSDKFVNINCPKCNTEITHKVDTGHTWKCNCDVEMTMDILNNSQAGDEVMIFSGDGDFAFLIEHLVEKGVKVYLVSSAKKIKFGPRYATSRFATKLRNLIAKYPNKIIYLDLDDWKMRIKQEII